jgi:hypothetical protein
MASKDPWAPWVEGPWGWSADGSKMVVMKSINSIFVLLLLSAIGRRDASAQTFAPGRGLAAGIELPAAIPMSGPLDSLSSAGLFDSPSQGLGEALASPGLLAAPEPPEAQEVRPSNLAAGSFFTRDAFREAFNQNYEKSETKVYVHRSIFSREYTERLPRVAMKRFVEDGLNSLVRQETRRLGYLAHEIPLPKGPALEADALRRFFNQAARPIPGGEADQPFMVEKSGVRSDGSEWTWTYSERIDYTGEQHIQVSLVECMPQRGQEYAVVLGWQQRQLRGLVRERWQDEPLEVSVGFHMNPIGTYQGMRTRAQGLSVEQRIRLSGDALSLSSVEVRWPLSSSPESAVARLGSGFDLHHGAVARLLQVTDSYASELRPAP